MPTTASSRARARCAAATSARSTRTLVDALYGGKQMVHVEAQVRYEDGRTGIHLGRPEDPRREDLPAAAARRRPETRTANQRAQAASARSSSRWTACRSPSAASRRCSDVSFDVREHEVRAIIGPNGAGKSSMLNVINGVYHPQQGTITLHGPRSTTTWIRTRSRVSGIARTFQNIALFKGMSVLDNIMTGRNLKMHSQHPASRRCAIGPALREEIEHRAVVEEHHRLPRDPGTSARRRSAACPTACRSASTSRARWPMEPRCCCSTSRWPA